MSDDPAEVFVDGGNPFSQIEDVIEPAFPGPTYDGSAAFLRKPHKFNPPKPIEELPPIEILPSNQFCVQSLVLEQNSVYLVKKNTEDADDGDIYEVKVKLLSPSGKFVKLARYFDSMKEEQVWYKISDITVLDRLY